MVASTDNEKAAFSRRLSDALTQAGIANDRQRRRWVATTFGVSTEAARKWLCGEAIPDTKRIPQIAGALGVYGEWLLTGRGPMLALDEAHKWVARPGSASLPLPSAGSNAFTATPKIEERRGVYNNRAADEWPDECMEAARLLSVLPEAQRKHLIEVIRMVYTAETAIMDPKIAALIRRGQKSERDEFYERWIEEKQAEYRARDKKKV